MNFTGKNYDKRLSLGRIKYYIECGLNKLIRTENIPIHVSVKLETGSHATISITILDCGFNPVGLCEKSGRAVVMGQRNHVFRWNAQAMEIMRKLKDCADSYRKITEESGIKDQTFGIDVTFASNKWGTWISELRKK